MIQNFKFTLWDLYVFFLTGFVVCFSVVFYLCLDDLPLILNLLKEAKKIPATHILFLLPFLFTTIGLLIEPLANFSFKVYDSFFEAIRKKIRAWAKDKESKHPKIWEILDSDIVKSKLESDEILEKEIKENHMKFLETKIEKPYHFCKTYVLNNSLSQEFMTFLARFGFYRNISFFFVCLAISSFFIYQSRLGVGTGLLLALAYKVRSDQFYSYQSPTVFNSYLVDLAFKKKEESKKLENNNE